MDRRVNHNSWRSKMVDLLAEKHKVFMMDNRGTGRSSNQMFLTTCVCAGCGYGFLKQMTDEAVNHILVFLEKVDG
jgi:pimeloyl-ACP methyl ester carboxylesterase